MIEVVIQSTLVKGTHRVDLNWNPDVIARKIELITGIPPESQEITIESSASHKKLLKNQTLGDAGITDGALIHVKDTNNTINIIDDGNVDSRYQMDLDEYEKRENTVLEWKRQNKLGRFSLDPNVIEQRDQQKNFGPVTVKQGDECYVSLATGKSARGIVEYIGEVEGIEPGTWIGVRTFTADGKNNGTVKGVKLFDAQPNHGILVRPNKVRRLDDDEEEL